MILLPSVLAYGRYDETNRPDLSVRAAWQPNEAAALNNPRLPIHVEWSLRRLAMRIRHLGATSGGDIRQTSGGFSRPLSGVYPQVDATSLRVVAGQETA